MMSLRDERCSLGINTNSFHLRLVVRHKSCGPCSALGGGEASGSESTTARRGARRARKGDSNFKYLWLEFCFIVLLFYFRSQDMNIKSAVLEQFHSPLQLREFPLPSQLDPGAALVRTEMAGICGTDVHLWKGELPIALPVILGHETVGILEQLGAGLESDWTGRPLQTGDRVTWTSAQSCGRCFYCLEKKQPTRCPERRAYGIGYRCDEPPHLLGGYAEYHYLRPGGNIFKLSDELPTDAVIGAGCALITAVHGVERLCLENRPPDPPRARMPQLPELWREWVVVQGAGPVGIAALAVAKNAGARNLLVIGGPKHRLDLAKRFGATHTLDIEHLPVPSDRIEFARQLTGGYGADTVLECVGRPDAVAEGMEMCRDGGKYLVLGHYCNAGPVPLNPHLITRKQLQVFGSWSSEPRHLEAALEFLRASRDTFPFASMISHRFPLEQANEALATTARWESAKSVIVPRTERGEPVS
jgi:L-iditol 2-dehydrogenase